MCLAVPGKLIEIRDGSPDAPGNDGTIDFQGSRVNVSLAFTPEAQLGDWLLVHAGFSIGRLEEAEAREVWDMLKEDENFRDQMPVELRTNGEGG